MAKKKKEWRFKHTLNGKWANIVIQSDFFKLGGIITDAYDYAVRELNQKGEKAMNMQDKLHLEHRKVVEEHTVFMEKYRLLKIKCKELKKENKMLLENLDTSENEIDRLHGEIERLKKVREEEDYFNADHGGDI